MAADPTFAARVKAAATRVVDLKIRMGLARCG
jgi:beta-N-acetylhexosaminidase